MPTLSRNAYGKSRVRLTKVTRHEDRHDLKEVDVDVQLEGDFEATYTTGDNSLIVATDSMKNTVYVLARHHTLDSIEAFGRDLAAHFANTYPQVAAATVHLTEQPWTRIAVAGAPHPTAFVSGGDERRVCTVTQGSGAEPEMESGLEDLLVLKTTHSEFSGFVRDAYTTLPETDDRIFATSVAARWRYAPGTVDWNAAFGAIRQALLETFADHHSLSVQQTLYAMGEAALAACAPLTEITLTMPNAHRILVNLAPFGLDNPNAVFVPTEAPFGLISGTLTRA